VKPTVQKFRLIALAVLSMLVLTVVALNLPTPVNAPPTDCTVSISTSGDITVAAGSSGSNTVTVTLLSGSCTIVPGCNSGLPSGASCNFVPSSGSPTYPTTLTITTSPSTPVGSHLIGVTATCTVPTSCTFGVSAGSNEPFHLVVQAAPPPPIPEYPVGLVVLAVFMIIGYGVIRRRTRYDKE